MTPMKRDLSDLPRGGGGLAPDDEPRFIGVLADAWDQRRNDDRKGRRSESVFWHSDAGKCARAISYRAADITQSDPMELTGVWNVTIGDMLHEAWQRELILRHGEDAVQVEVRLSAFDGASGRADAVITTDEPKVIAYELKTIGGFGYKAAVGKARRGSPAEGPKSDHLLQGALNALAIDADELVIGYLSKECISANVGKDMSELARFCCEWTFTREQFEPLAQMEAERVKGILALVEDGQLAARKMLDMPPGAEITDPLTGAWVQTAADGAVLDAGSAWNCNYCSWQSLCAGTPAGRIPVEQAVLLGGAA